jgi:trehalose 6-phosphate phosphatase
MSELPHIMSWLDDWLATDARLLLLADYDGTLTPIVESPDDARLAGPVHTSLEALARSPRIDVAVISGRDLADLRECVGVSGLIYAGCHGLEIEGPGISFRHPDAEAQQDNLGSIGRHLAERAPTVPGMRVEPKRFGVAVHYRHVAHDQIRRVETELARAIQQGGSRLKIFHGSRVIEVQPQVSWNKGDCVLWIRDTVQGASAAPLMALYMGDDWTDENAFEALAGQGMTIRVGAGAPASRADYHLEDVGEAQQLVAALAARCAGGSMA